MLPPEISVIVVNNNGHTQLERCLSALAISVQAAAPVFGVELIVVDNGSSDNSRSWMAEHYPPVRVIAAGKNLGFVQACRLGVKNATGRKIAFLDKETEVTPDWLLPLNSVLEQQDDVMAVCSQLVLLENPEIVKALGGGMARPGYSYERWFGFSTDHPQVHALCELRSFPTLYPTVGAMMMRKVDFLRFGGFDPAFYLYHESVDLGWRIWLAGGQVHVCPKSVVRHALSSSNGALQSSRSRSNMGMRHNLRTLIKCYQPKRIAHVLFDHLRTWVRTREFQSMMLILGWNLLHLPGTLILRFNIQRGRVLSDRALFESGLMSFAPIPPSCPEPPASHLTRQTGQLDESEADSEQHQGLAAIRPANREISAQLGCGWYPTEFVKRHLPKQQIKTDFLPPCGDYLPVRWTSGLARCWLQTLPHAQGRVWIRLCSQDQTSGLSWLEIRCAVPEQETPFQRWTFPPQMQWHAISLGVEADSQGRISLELRSSTQLIGQAGPNQDGRLIGVGVHDIRFENQQQTGVSPWISAERSSPSDTDPHTKAPNTSTLPCAAMPQAPSGALERLTRKQRTPKQEGSPQTPSSVTEVSVILVNYNGRAHLERCLPALVASVETAAPVFAVELIMVDNGSSDDSLAWMAQHFPQVRIIATGRNLGFGRANLLGAKAANGRKIAFLNNDTEVAPNWLLPLNAALEQCQQITALCSQLVLLEQPDMINALGGGMSRLGYSYDRLFGFSTDHPRVRKLCALETFPTLFPTAAAMLMRKADFFRLGGFDPAFFMYHEDVDLGWRIWLAGGQVHVCPASVVRHAFGGTTAKLQPSRFRDHMGMRHNLRTLIKCYQPRRLAHALIDHLRIWLQTRQLLGMLFVLSWNLLHLPGTLIQRWHIQRGRVLDDRAFFESGLMTFALRPPWGPSLPTESYNSALPDRIRSPKLCVTDETTSRRLGAGWYQLEHTPLEAFAFGQNEQMLPSCLDPVPIRWTNGLARCRLWVNPDAKGHLCLRLRTPCAGHHKERPWISIHCLDENQHQKDYHWTFNKDSLWRHLRFPVQANKRGEILVEIRSSIWSPESPYPSQEARLLGCGVHSLVFEQQQPPLPQTSYQPPSLSVIIPTYNRKSVLLRTLSALASQSVTGFEVVVVDDGSTDGTAEAVEHWRAEQGQSLAIGFQLLRQPNMKQGIARNHGLQQARGDLILFLGDDITPDADFIAEHLHGHQQHNQAGDVAILGITEWDESSVRTTPFLNHVNYEGAQFGYNRLQPETEAPFTCFYTSNISIRRDALGADPFDPRFDVYGWEDCELGLRLCSQGLRIIYHPDARAVHSHQMSLHSFLKRQRQIGEALHTFAAMEPRLFSLPSMGSVHLQRKLGYAGPVLRIISPLLSWLDRHSRRPWPPKIYGLLLSIAFGQGVLKGEKTS